MNVFSIIILLVLVLDFVLGIAANILNLRSLKLPVPAELEGIYKSEEYKKSQDYIRANTRLGLIKSAFELAVLLAFWLTGGFDYFDRTIRGFGLSEIPTGLIYTGILLGAYSLLLLPFSIYDTFVIEQRFGFNKTTSRTFVMDLIKGAGLALVVGGLLLTGVLALFQYFGGLAWLYCWISITIFSFIMQYVAPNWIMPLFNKFKPLGPGELRDAIVAYAASVEFPLKNILVMDGSRRSRKSNAFFTGFGSNKRIALFDTLIAQHTVAELVAVLAHEVGHYKKRHILQGMIISILHTGLLLFLLSLFVDSADLSAAFYMDQKSIYSGLLFFGLLYTPIELIISVIMNLISRRNEYQADRFAAKTTGDPQSMIEALKKLSAANLSNLTPHPFYVFTHYSHPPLLERVRAIQSAKK